MELWRVIARWEGKKGERVSFEKKVRDSSRRKAILKFSEAMEEGGFPPIDEAAAVSALKLPTQSDQKNRR